MNKIEKIRRLQSKLEKLAIQIKDDHYINWKNAKTQKIYDNFCFKILTEKWKLS